MEMTNTVSWFRSQQHWVGLLDLCRLCPPMPLIIVKWLDDAIDKVSKSLLQSIYLLCVSRFSAHSSNVVVVVDDLLYKQKLIYNIINIYLTNTER